MDIDPNRSIIRHQKSGSLATKKALEEETRWLDPSGEGLEEKHSASPMLSEIRPAMRIDQADVKEIYWQQSPLQLTCFVIFPSMGLNRSDQ